MDEIEILLNTNFGSWSEEYLNCNSGSDLRTLYPKANICDYDLRLVNRSSQSSYSYNQEHVDSMSVEHESVKHYYI